MIDVFEKDAPLEWPVYCSSDDLHQVNEEDWEKLEYIGIAQDGGISMPHAIEVRNCPICGARIFQREPPEESIETM